MNGGSISLIAFISAYPITRPNSPPHNREEHVLGQELPDQIPTSRTERGTHDDLALSRDAARQREIGEVGAADQQQEASRRDQQQKDRSGLGVDQSLGVWLHHDAPALVRGREVVFDALADRVHVGARLRKRDAVFQPGKRNHPMEVARHVRRLERQRPPELHRCAVERARRRQDADDRVRLVVEKDRAVDDGRIRAELGDPHAVTDDRHLVFAQLVLTGKKRPAQCRFGAKHLEVARGHQAASELDWFGAAGQRDRVAGLRRHEVEDGVVSLPVEEVQRRDAVALASRRLLHDADDAIGVRVGERLEQHRIHEAEDRRIGADADGQRQDGDGREPRALTECAHRVTDIPEQGRHETHLQRDAMAMALGRACERVGWSARVWAVLTSARGLVHNPHGTWTPFAS